MKIFLDGSIQGGSGRMLSPGYYKTGHNGAWNATPQVVEQQVYEIMSRGYQVHCHCNGDEASEAFIQAVEKTLNRIPAANHRATMQHAQMLREDQFKRIKSLGMCVNFSVTISTIGATSITQKPWDQNAPTAWTPVVAPYVTAFHLPSTATVVSHQLTHYLPAGVPSTALLPAVECWAKKRKSASLRLYMP